jgi:hypothetical protein
VTRLSADASLESSTIQVPRAKPNRELSVHLRGKPAPNTCADYLR